MSEVFEHRPVLLDNVVELLSPVPAGVVVDATVGGGGHAAALLERLPPLRLVGLDRDADALGAASAALARFGSRVQLRHTRFDALAEVLADLGITGEGGGISGILFDLGVSSPQFDRADRGFSYRFDAPLDMRMNRDDPLTAADIVNTADADALARLFAEHGEGRWGRRIAQELVRRRPVTTTNDVVDAVRAAIPAPARRKGGHPAKRVFQALRVEVNQELAVLPVALDAAIAALVPGGRIAVISYHSGEDRIVKERFRTGVTGGCTCPPGLPCVCGAVPELRLVTRGAVKPTADEIERNPRAESARLRVAERI